MISLADWIPRRAKNRSRKAKTEGSRLLAINWKSVAPALLSVVGSVLILGGITAALNRPVRHIEVTGAFQRVSAFDVEQVVRANLRGGFVTADLVSLQQSIEILPWVEHARVQRHWPDALGVQISEQAATARWGVAGLINARGDIFVKDSKHLPAELPQLDGPEGTEHQVTDLFLQLQPRMIDMGLSISGLRLDPRGAWELSLSNGIDVRFGRRQLKERIERFIKVGALVVASRANDIAFLDMRYSNGFSVGWRTSVTVPQHPATTDENPTTNKRDQDV
jgi:cell division protein FtsQ